VGEPIIDLDRLLARLRQEDHYSLAMQIAPRGRGQDLGQLKVRVDEAIDLANESAERRHPNDPTSCTTADVGLKALLAEINDGTMDEGEIGAWLQDFNEALGDAPVRITAQPRAGRVPWRTLDSWNDGTRFAPTAFLFYEARVERSPGGGISRRLDSEVVQKTADALDRWGRLANGGAIVSRGVNAYVCPKGAGGSELRKVYDEQLGLRQYTLHPRRLTDVKFSFDAKGTLQYFDETMTQIEMLDRTLDGLRAVGHLLDYAYVRLDRVGYPSEQVSDWSIGRDSTESEIRFKYSALWAIEHLIGTNVAQVLNPHHLSKGLDLSSFDTEALGNGRLLAVAPNPEAWLTIPVPPAHLTEDHATALGPALLNATPDTPLMP
jgi:hypothetical protein